MAATDIGSTVPEGRLSQESAWRQLYDDAGTPALFNAAMAASIRLI